MISELPTPSILNWPEGLKLLAPQVIRDARGFFLESYRREELADLGITDVFDQDNYSRSIQGTLRGLHYQSEPGQAKLVRCVSGAIFDVAVDLRSGSETYGAWAGVQLNERTQRMLYVPVGFAHGFLVLSDFADVAYKCSSYYDASTECGIAWNDPQLGIQWPLLGAPLLSERDKKNPSFAALEGKIFGRAP